MQQRLKEKFKSQRNQLLRLSLNKDIHGADIHRKISFTPPYHPFPMLISFHNFTQLRVAGLANKTNLKPKSLLIKMFPQAYPQWQKEKISLGV